MIDLSRRIRRDEQMDDPDLDPAIYAAVLSDLARVNAWTFTHHATIAWLDEVAGTLPAFRLLDVGFGQGDMLRAIAKWARRRNIAVDLVGVDLNPNSAAVARSATPPGMPIDYRTGDYRDVAHYTQIVWRGSTAVGCALASSRTDDYLVCRYSPPGNVVGQKAL